MFTHLFKEKTKTRYDGKKVRENKSNTPYKFTKKRCLEKKNAIFRLADILP